MLSTCRAANHGQASYRVVDCSHAPIEAIDYYQARGGQVATGAGSSPQLERKGRPTTGAKRKRCKGGHLQGRSPGRAIAHKGGRSQERP
ncbi:hypothetical protein GW17_00018945 [Ensete ventricosum]|nr:hypothetical protein GW17_00018945 [Ensete ventricosum]